MEHLLSRAYDDYLNGFRTAGVAIGLKRIVAADRAGPVFSSILGWWPGKFIGLSPGNLDLPSAIAISEGSWLLQIAAQILNDIHKDRLH